MPSLRLLAALALALTLGACFPPTTSHPVGMTVGLKPDPALTGLWKGKDHDGKTNYFHFLPQSDGSTVAILVMDGGKPDADWLTLKLTTAVLGNKHFINARLVSSGGKPDDGGLPGTIPVLYSIDAKGTLSLAMMNETTIKSAIGAGQIKGTVGSGTAGDATITADPPALDKFVQSPAGLASFATPFIMLRKME